MLLRQLEEAVATRMQACTLLCERHVALSVPLVPLDELMPEESRPHVDLQLHFAVLHQP